jgi:Ca2+-binding RTX toxin-like protein
MQIFGQNNKTKVFYNGSWSDTVLKYKINNAFVNVSDSFSPLDFPNLALWYDAMDGSTLYDATSGGNIVTEGNVVARWEDKSGNARHFTQSTTSERPLKIGSEVVFDGFRHMVNSNYTVSGKIFTALAVANRTGDTTIENGGYGTIVISSGRGGVDVSFHYNMMTYAGSKDLTITPTTNSILRVDGMSSNFLGDAPTGRKCMTGQTFVAPVVNPSFDFLVMGAQLDGNEKIAWRSRINMCEILLYEGTLPIESVISLENYLMNKWEI